MPEGAAPERPRRRRLGLRAHLLALLVPAMVALLAFDSIQDYLHYSTAVTKAYDRALLQPVIALDESVGLDQDGTIALFRPSAVTSMVQLIDAKDKYVHVGLVPLDAVGNAAGPQRLLLGEADLPGQPAGLRASAEDGRGGSVVLYDAQYRGAPVRMAEVQRVVRDGAGQRQQLRVQAAVGTGWRERARDTVLHQQLIEDSRMVLAMMLVVWLGVAWTLLPLKRLRDTLRQGSARRLEPLDASAVPREVAPLVEAVNQHIADHRRLLQEQAQFLADASHQLRTPLAVMMAQAGYALREHDLASMRETLQAIMDQLSRSRRLSEQLLSMAYASRAEEDTEPLAIVDLNGLAREVVLQYLTLALEMKQDLGFVDARGEDADESEEPAHTGPAVPVRARAAELHEAFANLVHNAIRYTPVGGMVTVRVKGGGIVEIEDNGPGIPSEFREKVRQRFYRMANAESGGCGLGLAIVDEIAAMHGAELVLSDPPQGHGLVVAVRFREAAAAA